MPISILLADDHKLFRESIRGLLEQQPDFRIVGEAANGLEALTLAMQLRPTLLVLDVAMPGLGGLEVIRQIKQRYSEMYIVVLSGYNDEGYVIDALSHGASAYVLKEQSVGDLVLAIKATAAGYRYLSPPLSERALEIYLGAEQVQTSAPSKAKITFNSLTKREQEILTLTEHGLSSQDIARRLGVSAATVETHRAYLILKLGLRSRAELLAYVRQQQQTRTLQA
jgi:two-component system, NarL family, response regulator NreC